MSDLHQFQVLREKGISRGIRISDRWQHSQSSNARLWLRMGLEMDFDDYVLTCVFSRALEEIDAGQASATEATGLSRAELRDVLTRSFPAKLIDAFFPAETSDPELGTEEKLLRDLLLSHARPNDPVSARFAKIIARRALRDEHLWQDLGLFDRAELGRLFAMHFPTLAAGNTNNMRWKKYLYRKLCEAEGFSLCAAPSCQECSDFKSCFGPETDEASC
ncbi:nitrogen fixation protein NifQ (plasmid) [Rhizobium sp. CB3060]|uniref:nitrogen fixation protein NifQ n=1 Tax=Rhizobium sp. CB3060 TaxID=3138255 RepID=UPI0021A3D5B9|nr:nitrogen fixation protein NifQ [Rhizobium tropici]UWU25794.1 nitrogen fixation protein NifQ [Rhizobium tropici]